MAPTGSTVETTTPEAAERIARPRRGVFHTLRVASVERLCDDAVAVSFEVPDALRDDYDFEAGQSLTLRRVIDGEDHRRDYSICARVGDPPRVGVRLIPGGRFSEWLVNEVRPGDEVEVQTPRGSLRARADGGRHLLVAAGSGITPMLSIAATVLTHPDSRVTLLYGNRTTS
jgi:ring-1,2-phenylacetyl-CoA epoxidase subunit PaaE